MRCALRGTRSQRDDAGGAAATVVWATTGGAATWLRRGDVQARSRRRCNVGRFGSHRRGLVRRDATTVLSACGCDHADARRTPGSGRGRRRCRRGGDVQLVKRAKSKLCVDPAARRRRRRRSSPTKREERDQPDGGDAAGDPTVEQTLGLAGRAGGRPRTRSAGTGCDANAFDGGTNRARQAVVAARSAVECPRRHCRGDRRVHRSELHAARHRAEDRPPASRAQRRSPSRTERWQQRRPHRAIVHRIESDFPRGTNLASETFQLVRAQPADRPHRRLCADHVPALRHSPLLESLTRLTLRGL